MRSLHFAAPVAGMLLAAACACTDSPAPAARRAPGSNCDRTASAASGPLLELILDVEPWLETGKPIEPRLSLLNRSCDPVTLVRPTPASWDELGYPRYRLEIRDEAGDAVADALAGRPGAAAQEERPLTAADFVTVAAGKTAPLFEPPALGDPLALRLAPGMYDLRVRYAAPRVDSAAETLRALSAWNAVRANDLPRMVILVSNIVPIRVDHAAPAQP